jgi:arabinofuranan 3-O-arabinosyltransferase
MTATAPATSTALHTARGGRHLWRWVYLGLAAIAYIPYLVSAPGRVSVDTKLYLFLDPSRLLSNAPYLWDPSYAAGTVTHQNIGYVFPMGPWFWAFDALQVPDWIAQRLWFGSIVFAAGAGVLFLCRTLAKRDAGAVAAALVYMLSPYVLAYTARQSVILLPWAGLPWLLALTERSLRRGGWRDPALFALLVLTIGGTNATSLIFVGIAPLLWIVFRVAIDREVSWRDALRAMARIGVLIVATSTWWIAGLSIQRDFGIPVLNYTETVKAVAASSSAIEVMRGLGNWFFYGRDGVGPWILQSPQYQQGIGLLATGFAIPVLAFASAIRTRWRHRAYFATLTLVGTIVAVGVYPYDDPSPVGRVFKAFAEGSTAGLALRSTPRAVPLVALGLAMLLGAGISAVAITRPRVAFGAAAVVAVLALVNLAPAWQGDFVKDNLSRPSGVPQYWEDAAAYLDAQGDDTRILEVPGQDFAVFRWGATVDPLLPGLTDRPWVGRELVPYGSDPAADLLTAFDRRFQEGVLEPAAIAPIARLFAAGDVVVRNDLQYERYRTPRPKLLQRLLAPTPKGLRRPATFGPGAPNRAGADQPMIDPEELSIPAGTVEPPEIQVYPVERAESIVRTARSTNPVLLAGDGEGIVDAASAGVIDGRALVIESGTYAKQPRRLRQLLDAGADLVLTDTNRRRARIWGAARDVTGYTEISGEQPLEANAGDQRLTVFPDANDDARTVAVRRGVKLVRASGYGAPNRFTPEDRPSQAFDGDPTTAWTVGDDVDPIGQRLVVALESPVTTDHLTLTQPQTGLRNRSITRVGVRLDGGDVQYFDLGPESLTSQGQQIDFGERTFENLEVSVEAVESPSSRRGPVGFAEVAIPGVQLHETIRLPVDLLRTAGDDALGHDLTVLLTRQRGSQAEYARSDEEPALDREFDLPQGRSFGLTGIARLDANAPDEVLDSLLGLADASGGGVTARSSSHLEGSIASRARAAIDGNDATSWVPAFTGDNVGQWIDVTVPAPVTVDGLDLRLVADGRHSVPTRLTIQPVGAAPFTIDVPEVHDGSARGTVVEAPVRFPVPVTTAGLRVMVDAVRPVTSTEYFGLQPIELPIGIAELGIPGVRATTASGAFATACRTDLVVLDARPLSVRVSGVAPAAEARQALTLEGCDADAAGLTLASGRTTVRAAPGRETGLDVDRLSLASAAGGAPRAEALLGVEGGGPGPRAAVDVRDGRSYDVRVSDPDGPFWLVLSQSYNDGWDAELAGGTSLGPPTLVNGAVNAWLVEPKGTGDMVVHVRWTPQTRVWIALGLTALGVLLCLVLALRRRREWRGRVDERAPAAAVRSWAARVQPRAPRLTLVAAPIALGLLGALVAALWVGLVVALATVGSFLDRRVRTATRVVAVGALVVAAGFVVAQQLRQGYPAAYDWPQRFLRVNDLPWLALLLLAVSVVVDRVLDPSEASDRSGAPGSAD